ncbi:hypothetical protein [Mixta hanseatica]|uniref:SMI1/KNR4 family protein n=1 Tax=Mixta hanseatica TaxID=2872648 RepID=A0ABY4R4W8_9GAMM|nr:hypothetical protein [Mixta hanseatica]UQY43281.1 hypothetical protein K6958_15500 [Mixta hanseatica]
MSLRIKSQREKVYELRDAFPELPIIIKYNNFIDYVDQNRNITYYHINRIRLASGSENDHEVFEVVSYFCGGGSNFLDLIYCYYNEDDTDPVAIEAESYYNALTFGKPPISLSSGCEIDDFDVRNISFYCILDWEKE